MKTEPETTEGWLMFNTGSPNATPEQEEVARTFLAVLSAEDFQIFDSEVIRVTNQPQWWFRTALDRERERRARAQARR